MKAEIKKLVEKYMELNKRYLDIFYLIERLPESLKSAHEIELSRVGGQLLGIDFAIEAISGKRYSELIKDYFAE